MADVAISTRRVAAPPSASTAASPEPPARSATSSVAVAGVADPLVSTALRSTTRARSSREV